MHRRLGSVTLPQLAFPRESNPNFPWEKSQWDRTIQLLKNGNNNSKKLKHQSVSTWYRTPQSVILSFSTCWCLHHDIQHFRLLLSSSQHPNVFFHGMRNLRLLLSTLQQPGASPMISNTSGSHSQSLDIIVSSWYQTLVSQYSLCSRALSRWGHCQTNGDSWSTTPTTSSTQKCPDVHQLRCSTTATTEYVIMPSDRKTFVCKFDTIYNSVFVRVFLFVCFCLFFCSSERMTYFQ